MIAGAIWRYHESILSTPDNKLFHWQCLSIPTNLADDRKASYLFPCEVKSKMLVNCCICRQKPADYDEGLLKNLRYFWCGKPAILNIAEAILNDLPKRRQHFQHFGLKYLSNDGINQDHFHCEHFLKIYTFRPAKNTMANFEWSVPLRWI